MARTMFSQYAKGERIDDNLKGQVLKIVAWNGNAKTFDALLSIYKKETNALDKVRCLAALGLFKDKALCSRALKYSLSKEVKYQDTFYVSGYVASNPIMRRLILDWVVKNWKTLLFRYPVGVHIIDSFVSDLSGQRDILSRKQVAAFFTKKSNTRGDVAAEIRKTLERIDANVRFMKANGVSAE